MIPDVQYSTVQYSRVQYGTVQYSIVQYIIKPEVNPPGNYSQEDRDRSRRYDLG